MAWSHKYDVNTPAGTDDPKEGDDRIREVKAALQERLAKDHYFPKDGSEVSDTDAGEHKKVTLRVGNAPTKADDKGFIYAKNAGSPAKAELFYIDEDGNEVQLTSGGERLTPKMYGAIGTSNINTESATYVDMADMSITETFKAGDIFISFSASITITLDLGGNDSAYAYISIVIDGDTKKVAIRMQTFVNNSDTVCGDMSCKETLSAGEHTIKIQWKTVAGKKIESTGTLYERTLNIITTN